MEMFKFKKREGAALIWVLFVFVLLMIITSTIFYLQRQNIFEAARQEERLQTYYIALAGIDLTYAAIMEINENENRISTTITDKIGSGLSENIVIKTDNVKRGTAEVEIDRIEEIIDGKKVYWLRITSVGKLEGKEIKVKSVMRINEKRVTQIVREN